VTGADAGAVVAVEIFVEQQIVPPIRIALEFFGTAEHRPTPGFVAQKDPGQPIGDLAGDLEQVHRLARAGRTFDPEVVAVIEVVLHQSANQQHIDRHPYRSAPVRVAAEHAGVRLRRQIIHPVFLPADIKNIGMICVIPGQCPARE